MLNNEFNENKIYTFKTIYLGRYFKDTFRNYCGLFDLYVYCVKHRFVSAGILNLYVTGQ